MRPGSDSRRSHRQRARSRSRGRRSGSPGPPQPEPGYSRTRAARSSPPRSRDPTPHGSMILPAGLQELRDLVADQRRGVDHGVVGVDAERVVRAVLVIGGGIGAQDAARAVVALRPDVPDEHAVAVRRRTGEVAERRQAGEEVGEARRRGPDRASGSAAARRSSAPRPRSRRSRPGGRRRPSRSARGGRACPGSGSSSCGSRSRSGSPRSHIIWIIDEQQRPLALVRVGRDRGSSA